MPQFGILNAGILGLWNWTQDIFLYPLFSGITPFVGTADTVHDYYTWRGPAISLSTSSLSAYLYY